MTSLHHSVLLLFVSIFFVPCSFGQMTWLGGDGSWQTGSFWSQGVPPSSFSNVFVDGGNGIDSTVTIFNIAAGAGTLTIDEGDVVALTDNSSLTFSFAGASIENHGDLRITNVRLGASALRIHEDTLLTGSGTITMGGPNSGLAIIDNVSGALHSITNVDSTIQGAGNIGTNAVQLINEANGLIDANDPAGNLRLDPSPFGAHVNRGIMRASDGGRLAFFVGNFDNADGVIEALNNSVIELTGDGSGFNGADITGGELRTQGTGLVELSVSQVSTLRDITLDADIVTLGNSTLALEGDIINQGTITVTSDGLFSRLRSETADTVVTGPGTIDLANVNSQIIGNDGLEIQGGTLTGIGRVDMGSAIFFNSATVAPGNSVGTLRFFNPFTSVHLLNDTTLEIEVSATSGTPGVDWDQITVVAPVVFDDAELPAGITINLSSLDSNGDPGPLSSFDPNSNFSIPIIQAGGVLGFDAANFFVDRSGFANSTSGHFFVSVDGSDNVILNYEFALLGDVNGDGNINLLDVAPFVAAISGGAFVPEADINQDGLVNLLDVADFVELLSN